MTSENYTLEIVSRDKDHDGEVFQAYSIDGDDTIGVSKREPFEIVLRNKTWNRIQVRLSVDGTDVLTGEKATTNPSGKMFLVEGRGTLKLAAWPEDDSKGARFIFGTNNKGVALNTHGDTSGVGVIAAAVFTEGEPVYMTYSARISERSTPLSFNNRRTRLSNDSAGSDGSAGNVTKGVTRSLCSAAPAAAAPAAGAGEAIMGFMDQEHASNRVKCAVGAGETIKQSLAHAKGLNKPKLDATVQVRYEWWTELQTKLSRFKKTSVAANPFPGDRKNIDLSDVPKQSSTAKYHAYRQYA
jgi:hypothetical protein